MLENAKIQIILLIFYLFKSKLNILGKYDFCSRRSWIRSRNSEIWFLGSGAERNINGSATQNFLGIEFNVP
jgi:hypothetical protein